MSLEDQRPAVTTADDPMGDEPWTLPAGSSALTAGEVLVLGLVAVVAIVAEVSLLLAHARTYALTATAVLSTLTLVALGLTVWRHGAPAIRAAPRQLAVLGGLVVLSIVLFTPGFPVGMAGWDPGVYVNHGLAISRTGSYDLPDPVLSRPQLRDLPGVPSRFPGTVASELDEDRSVVGFYHLYPALLAPAADLAGERGAVNVNPLLGVLAVLSIALLVGRAFGELPGGLAGVLASLNMIQVWHARYPTSEVLTQLLVTAALLAIVVAHQTGWRVAAGLAGTLTGLTLLARGDSFLVVLLAVGALTVLALAGRFDRRCAWFTAGLVITLPHSLLQAYVFAATYTRSQRLPELPLLAAALVVLTAAGAAGALLRRAAVRRRVDDIRTWVASDVGRRWTGGVAVAAFSGLLVLNYVRPLLGPAELPISAPPDVRNAYFAARGLVRLTWFFTPVGIAALWGGLTVVALRGRSFSRWVTVLPCLALFPIYLANPRISPRLMWWTRRFVPFALAGMIVLVAVGLAACLAHRGHWRLPIRVTGAVAAAFLMTASLAMSWPLRDHSELDGSLAIHHDVAAVAGDGEALWLWSSSPGPPGVTGSASAFASTMLYRRGDAVHLLPADASTGDVHAFLAAFPDRPAFVVGDGDQPPPPFTAGELRALTRIHRALPLWELTYDERPDEAAAMVFDFTIWRLTTSISDG